MDPCDPPDQLEKAILENQTYILGKTDAEPYVHPEFPIFPSYCPIKYTYSITELLNSTPNSAISRDGKSFSFEYLTDTEPLGQVQTVSITATSNSIYDTLINSPLVESEDFELSFDVDCEDGRFISLTSES